MADPMLVFYGSYRSDRLGIRLADFVVGGFRARGESAELIDAKAVGLPMLDRMYKEYPAGTAPPAMETLAAKIRTAHAFIFVVGEYNWGMHRDRQLLCRATCRSSVQCPMAWDTVRNGHGGNLQHHCRRSNRAHAQPSR
jgi:hypothetical protein